MSGGRGPRCARPMLRYKASRPVPGMTACGRPAGHNGDCRSVEACERYQAADVRRITEKRRSARLTLVPTPPASLSACGMYLAYLLHLDRGEVPCELCAANPMALARRRELPTAA